MNELEAEKFLPFDADLKNIKMVNQKKKRKWNDRGRRREVLYLYDESLK